MNKIELTSISMTHRKSESQQPIAPSDFHSGPVLPEGRARYLPRDEVTPPEGYAARPQDHPEIIGTVRQEVVMPLERRLASNNDNRIVTTQPLTVASAKHPKHPRRRSLHYGPMNSIKKPSGKASDEQAPRTGHVDTQETAKPEDRLTPVIDTRGQAENVIAPTESEPKSVPFELTQEVVDTLKRLLDQDTLEAHEEAFRYLEEKGLTGAQRWPKLHDLSNGNVDKNHLRHNFSDTSSKLVNEFAQVVAKLVPLDKDSLILELGSGYGNDAVYFGEQTGASVLALDKAPSAVTGSREYIDHLGLGGTIKVDHGDFLETVKEMESGAILDMVYAHSTLHYTPKLVLQEQILPRLARMLRREDGSEPGKLCLAMKTSGSASAKCPDQIPLAANDNDFNPKVHSKEGIFRNYPTPKALRNVIEKHFNIEYFEIREVNDYDKDGDVEEFVYVIASPKPLTEAQAA